ncbi:MAG: DUF2069 domain-containing protein [Proteobacteria bacterium]|uniref:DUF2069 domain-containing protein n=1 Tax=Rudaea sp. TaxID=2136325 RepID=UPI001D7AE69A|nr:DUF2069 domain-containing protein [Pseudomonadota bacterium]MBS0568535.1 DUF2069 domain-containing protein [Pseudomonadota bacterium]
MSPALRFAVVALAALLALQPLWHAWLAPPKPDLLVPTLVLAITPLLLSLWIAAKSLRRGALIGGMVCLFYFSHGVAELWSGAAPRWPALAETALALLVVFALGWEVRANKRAS